MLSVSDFIMWSLRKNPKDITTMYETFSPLMCNITNDTMLNFGYWDDSHDTPALAQKNMCRIIANIADFSNSKYTVLDVGSGFCSPAMYWKSLYPNMDIHCVNISYKQLYYAVKSNIYTKNIKSTRNYNDIDHLFDIHCNTCHNNNNNNNNNNSGSNSTGNNNSTSNNNNNSNNNCNRNNNNNSNVTNATATMLPFASDCVDYVVALESAQHFNPFENFIVESKRVLTDNGVLIIAIPIILKDFLAFTRLGILNFTWASEHYTLKHIHKAIQNSGFKICNEKLIGKNVYGPLANYYTNNQTQINRLITEMQYPLYMKSVIIKSMKKMKKASDSGIIDYAIIRCSV